MHRIDICRATGRDVVLSADHDERIIAGPGLRDRALLPVMERVLGPEHPKTQDVRGKLGYWTSEADGDVSPGVK